MRLTSRSASVVSPSRNCARISPAAARIIIASAFISTGQLLARSATQAALHAGCSPPRPGRRLRNSVVCSSCGARSGPAPPGYANDPLRSSSFVDGDGGGGLYPHPDSMRPSISDGVGSPGRGSPDRGPRLSEAERRRSSFNAYI